MWPVIYKRSGFSNKWRNLRAFPPTEWSPVCPAVPSSLELMSLLTSVRIIWLTDRPVQHGGLVYSVYRVPLSISPKYINLADGSEMQFATLCYVCCFCYQCCVTCVVVNNGVLLLLTLLGVLFLLTTQLHMGVRLEVHCQVVDFTYYQAFAMQHVQFNRSRWRKTYDIISSLTSK